MEQFNGEIHTQFMDKAAIAIQNGREDLAEKYLDLEEKVRGKPTSETLTLRAYLERTRGNDDKAFDLLRQAKDISDNDEIRQFYISQLIDKGEYDEANNEIANVKDEQTRLLLTAELKTFTGFADEAESIYEDIINRWPDCQQAYIKLVRISRKVNKELIDPTKIEALADNPATQMENAIGLYNVLGKFYEDTEDYEKSNHFYRKSCDLKRKEFPNDVMSRFRSQVEAVTDYYTKEMLENVPTDCEDSKLLFVFGMPRSGTTLTEQCLVSHTQIETLGETENVSVEIEELAALVGSEQFPNNPDEVQNHYIKNRIGEIPNCRYLVDKMPGNYSYIGLMYQMFPKAKFVYVKRNPLNNCWATYTTIFANGHAYSYTPSEMVEMYKIHEKYMEHWLRVLPEGTIHVVEYEDLVTNSEKVVRGLLDYLGLDFQKQCVEPHKTRRPIRTASMTQAIRPIYTSSINRAEKYGDLLNDFKELLNENY